MVPGQFFVIDARNLDVNVNAVKEWTADAVLISYHLRERVRTFLQWIIVVTIGASLTKDTGLAYVAGDQTFNKEQALCLSKILSLNCSAA
jgi:hypothetical protein